MVILITVQECNIVIDKALATVLASNGKTNYSPSK